MDQQVQQAQSVQVERMEQMVLMGKTEHQDHKVQ
jgi:hypothetical protein